MTAREDWLQEHARYRCPSCNAVTSSRAGSATGCVGGSLRCQGGVSAVVFYRRTRVERVAAVLTWLGVFALVVYLCSQSLIGALIWSCVVSLVVYGFAAKMFGSLRPFFVEEFGEHGPWSETSFDSFNGEVFYLELRVTGGVITLLLIVAALYVGLRSHHG